VTTAVAAGAPRPRALRRVLDMYILRDKVELQD
jgi:hypothetical protein